MKKFKLPVFLILIVFIAFCLSSCGSKESENSSTEQTSEEDTTDTDCAKRSVLIELNVNTANITLSDIEENSRFTGQHPDTVNAKFTTKVKKGDRVIWVGVSTSSLNDKVEILEIIYESGYKVLTQDSIEGNSGVVVGDVITKIDEMGIDENKEEKYIIKYKVHMEDGTEKGPFDIDPKLRI